MKWIQTQKIVLMIVIQCRKSSTYLIIFAITVHVVKTRVNIM